MGVFRRRKRKGKCNQIISLEIKNSEKEEKKLNE